MIKKGSVDRSIVMLCMAADGTPKTDVTAASAGLALSFWRPGGSVTALTALNDLGAANSAHTDGGIKHLGGGAYRIDPQDAAWASGADQVHFFGAVTGGAWQKLTVELMAVDLQDTVRAGLTALPNAAANTAGGLASAVRLAGTLPSQTGASAAAGTVNLASGGISADNEGVGELLVVFSAAFAMRGAGVITASTNSTDRVTLNNGSALDFTPTDGDTYARIMLPGVAGMDAAGVRAALGLSAANLDTQLIGIQSDTNDIQTRLPAALVSGRMDASVGAMASNVVTAAAIATNAIDADALAADAVTEIQSGLATASALATVAGYVDTEVAAIKAKTDNLPTDPADASDIAASFSSVSGTLSTIAGYLDTEVAAIKAKTDNLPALPAAAGDVPSAAAVANAVLDATASSHNTAGTIGNKINSAGSAGDPWATSLPGAYASDQAGKILGDNLAAAIAGVKAKTDLLPEAPASADDIPSANTVAGAVLNATAAAYDAAGSIGEKINDIGSGGGSAPTVTQIRQEMDANSTKLANLDATMSSRLAGASYSTAPSASAVAAAVLDAADGIDDGVTVRDALKGLAAVQLGKMIISGNTYTFRNFADTADVLVATVSNGRTSITFTPG